MGESVSVDRMEISDLPRVLEIERRSFKAPWTRYAFLKFLKEQTSFCIVARGEAEVVGYGVAWFTPNECHVGNVAVEETYRRKGIGTLLLKSMLREARERGAIRATLEVRMSNSPAISLYKRHGFQELAIRRGYYYPDGEDALVMMKEIQFDESQEGPGPATQSS